MHRIDGPGATVDNKFTEGNPATAVPATDVTDDWLNDVQEELMSVLVNAGISPVKGTRDQLLKAIRIGNASDSVILSASGSIAAADIGKYFNFSGVASTLTITLPAASAVRSGSILHFKNNSAFAQTLSRAGSDQIASGQSTVATTFSIPAGASATLIRHASAGWLVADGTADEVAQGNYVASLSGNGYQRLPSGLIIQWCEISLPMAAANTNYPWTATLPITFPNACRQAFASFGSSNPPSGFLNLTVEGLAAGAITGFASASTANTRTIRVYAIGN